VVTEIDPAGAVVLRRRMVQRLLDLGFVPAGWEEALEAVPRHAFVPDLVWHPIPRGYLPLCRGDDPAAWLGLAYRDDERIVAQVDDGTPEGIGRHPSCTVLSMSEVTWLLSLVTAAPGARVCVVGAGLGYLTALLAHRFGAGAVSAVEIDPGIAADCRRRLAATGLGGVEVLTRDGTLELPAGAAFDLLLSTVAVQRVPGEWLRRVRPGGTIITGYGTAYCHDAVVRLQVHHARNATGRVVGEIECEWERRQRIRPALTAAEVDAAAAGTDAITFDVNHPNHPYDACFAIGIRVPNCVQVPVASDDVWFVDADTGSRAHWHRSPAGRYRVDHYGPRRLWDEIDAAHRWWVAAGRPEAGDWLVTATPDATATALPLTVAAAG